MTSITLLTLRRFAHRFAISLFASFILLSATALAQQTIKVYPASIRLEKGKTRNYTAVAFDSSGNYMPNQNFTFSRSSGSSATASVKKVLKATRKRIIRDYPGIWRKLPDFQPERRRLRQLSTALSAIP